MSEARLSAPSAPSADTLIRPHVRDLQPYEPILPLEALSRQLGRAPEQIVKLDANENPYGPIPAVRAALAELPHPHIYPDPQSTALREALSAYVDVPVENLLAGAGADELIDLTMRLFLEPGDAILVCPPTFGMYAFDAAVNAARTMSVPRRADFSLDLDEIARAVAAEKPKLLFLANPNNPDGSRLRPGDLERLLALPLVVVLDEAYVEFAPPPRPEVPPSRPGRDWVRTPQGVNETGRASRIGAVPEHGNLIVLRTFSKWAGLAGLRVGYGAFPARLMPHLWKIKQPYNVSVAAAGAALAALAHVEELDALALKIAAERERLFGALQDIPFLAPYPSAANFVLCRVIGPPSASRLKAALAERGILIRFFDKPGLRDHVRISVGKPEHTDMLLAAIRNLHSEIRNPHSEIE